MRPIHPRCLLVPLLAVVLSAGTPPGPAAKEAEVAWLTDLSRALKSAAAGERPILADVWAVWCAPCKLMDQTTYRDAVVLAAISDFVPLKIDHDAQEIFVENYAVEALPVVLFLDDEGREIRRMTGLVEAAPLQAAMDQVLRDYADYRDAMKRATDPAAATRLADYLSSNDNPSRAEEVLRRAIKALPKGAEPPLRESLLLRQAEIQTASGESRSALETLERLAATAATPELQARALVGLELALRQRGRLTEADAAAERLRREFSAEPGARGADQP